MNASKEEIAAAMAANVVEEREDLEVDFEWVMRAFLGNFFHTNHGWKGEKDILLAVWGLFKGVNL